MATGGTTVPDAAARERVAAMREAIGALTGAQVAGARWSGVAGLPVRGVEVVDVFELGGGGLLAVLDVRAGDAGSPPVRCTLPSDDPLLGVRAGPSPWGALHALATGGGSVAGEAGARLVGRPAHGSAAATPGSDASDAPDVAVRRSPGDQSHTSVIVDERSVLKLYRRLTAGPNVEAELLEALAGVPTPADVPVPAWRGAVELVLPSGETTAVAIEQAFVAGAVDAFEALADGLAAWLAAGDPSAGRVTTRIPEEVGIATGRLHAALASVDDPAFLPRDATAPERAAWLEAAEARLRAAIVAVAGVDAALAAWIEQSAPAIRRGLRPLGDPAIAVRLGRVHGDLHLGQVLATDDGVVLVDFEGDPMRDPADRRAPASPLRDVAAFLRSIDHVARSGVRRAGILLGHAPSREAAHLLDGWIAEARGAFLGGYAASSGSPGWGPDRALLRAFELDKEMAEFAYAATFLPAWLYAPTGGLRALLGSTDDGA